MIRASIDALASAVAIALSIGIVIAFAAVGCMLNQRDAAHSSHTVKGVRAPIASHLSSNR